MTPHTDGSVSDDSHKQPHWNESSTGCDCHPTDGSPELICPACLRTAHAVDWPPENGKPACSKLTLGGISVLPTDGSLDDFLDYCMERTVYMQDERIAGDWREYAKKPMRKKLEALIAAQVQQGKLKSAEQGFYHGYKQGLENKPPIFVYEELESFIAALQSKGEL